MLAAHHQFANDEHRPAFVEQLHRLGDRAELSIAGCHLSRVGPGMAPVQMLYRFGTDAELGLRAAAAQDRGIQNPHRRPRMTVTTAPTTSARHHTAGHPDHRRAGTEAARPDRRATSPTARSPWASAAASCGRLPRPRAAPPPRWPTDLGLDPFYVAVWCRSALRRRGARPGRRRLPARPAAGNAAAGHRLTRLRRRGLPGGRGAGDVRPVRDRAWPAARECGGTTPVRNGSPAWPAPARRSTPAWSPAGWTGFPVWPIGWPPAAGSSTPPAAPASACVRLAAHLPELRDRRRRR